MQGLLVVFAAAICFRNGRSFTQLRAVRLPGRRGLIFQAEDGGFYRIPGFKALDYAIAPAPPPVAARGGAAAGRWGERRKAGRGRVRSKGARLEDFPHVPARLE